MVTAMLQVLQLMAALYVAVFLIVLFAGPAAAIASGRSVSASIKLSARADAAGVAALMALLLTCALLLPTIPGRLAAFVNPLMAEIFLAVGAIGGAALAVGLFGRWMYAPALVALEGMTTTAALDASHARARRERNFGFALSLAALFAIIAVASGTASTLLAGIVPGVAPLASWLGVWVALTIVPSLVAGSYLQGEAARSTPSTPTLALRSRPSQCPRCGALATVASQSSRVQCPRCGLQATLR
jgi:ribosomal protein S27AE